jgi:hypothetical protein
MPINLIKSINMEGTRPIIIIMEGTPPLTWRALPNLLMRSECQSQNRACFDFDFKILTAFIRLGRAGPAGAGCPPKI